MRKIKFNLNLVTLIVIGFYFIDFILRDTFGRFFINSDILLIAISLYSVFYFIRTIPSKKNLYYYFDLILFAVLFSLSLLSISHSFILLRNVGFNHFIWFFLVYYFFRTQDDLDQLFSNVRVIFYLIVLASSIITVLSFGLYIFETILKIDLPFQSWSGYVESGRRLRGLLSNPNPLGHLALMGGICSLTLAISERNKFYKISLIVIMLINIIVIFLTDCRSALVAMGVILLFVVFFYRKKFSIKNKVLRVVVIILIIIILYFAIYRILGLRRFSGLNLFNRENTTQILNVLTSERYSIWIETLELGKQNPIFGNGYFNLLGQAKVLLGNQSIIVIHNIEVPHNIFMEMYYSTGLIGLGFFVALCTKLVIDTINCLKQSKELRVLLIVASTYGLFTISMLDVGVMYSGFISPLFWLTVGSAVSISEILNKNKQMK